jgi:hypothetical protein
VAIGAGSSTGGKHSVPFESVTEQIETDADVREDGPPAGLWAKMKADPEYAPEHLALEAVTRLGPKMSAELEKLKGQNPGAPPDALANMIIYRYVNQSRLSGAVSGAVPLAGAVLDVGVLAWTQARMVLMLAANYGADPANPDRAVELLVLQGIHKYTQTARTALAVARGRERVDALLPGERPEMRRVLMKLALKLAQMAGVRAVKKMAAKLIPGAAIILGGVTNGKATRELGGRAIAMYRRPPMAPYPQLPQQPHGSAQFALPPGPPQPSAGASYPPPGASHAPPGASYPPPGASYPPPGASHAPPGASYPPPGASHAPPGGSYPSAGASYPQPQPPGPAQASMPPGSPMPPGSSMPPGPPGPAQPQAPAAPQQPSASPVSPGPLQPQPPVAPVPAGVLYPAPTPPVDASSVTGPPEPAQPQVDAPPAADEPLWPQPSADVPHPTGAAEPTRPLPDPSPRPAPPAPPHG